MPFHHWCIGVKDTWKHLHKREKSLCTIQAEIKFSVIPCNGVKKDPFYLLSWPGAWIHTHTYTHTYICNFSNLVQNKQMILSFISFSLYKRRKRKNSVKKIYRLFPNFIQIIRNRPFFNKLFPWYLYMAVIFICKKRI